MAFDTQAKKGGREGEAAMKSTNCMSDALGWLNFATDLASRSPRR